MSVRILSLWISALLSLAGLGPEPAQARTPSSQPSSCDGIVDFSDELRPSGYTLVRQTALGNGIDEVEIRFDVSNVDAAQFAAATATPEFDAALGVIPDSLRPAEFDAIGPNASAVPVQTLQLQLPSANVADLLAELSAGTIPFVVHADEEPVLHPDVEVHEWSSNEDAGYALARDSLDGLNPDPGPAPWPAGQIYGMHFLVYGDDVPSLFEDFAPGEVFFLEPDADALPTEIPEALHFVRVHDAQRVDDEGDGVTIWAVTAERSDSHDLTAVFQSGSFCTGTSAWVDLPVQASRLTKIDRDYPEAGDKDQTPQGIRFNDIPLGTPEITLSGQITGHALRPSLEIRLRGGQVRAVADIDTDLSVAVQLRAEAELEFDPEPIELLDLCFPLPTFQVGPIPIGLNLGVGHLLEADGHLSAGAEIGLSKRFEGGFTIGFDARRADGDRYFSESRHAQPHPVEFTPPRLLDSTSAHASVATEIRTVLRVGAVYPFCDTGFGAWVGARAGLYLDVEPTQPTWWSLDHEAELLAGIDLQVLGLDIAAHGTGIDVYPGEGRDSDDATSARAAADAAPAAKAADALAAGFSSESSGEDQRWSVAIDQTDVPNGVDHSSVVALADGGAAVVAREPIHGRSSLIKLDRFGALEWSHRYDSLRKAREILLLPDGTLLVAGEPNWLARHDLDGNLLWSTELELGRVEFVHAECWLEAVVALEQAPGVYDYVGVGVMGNSVVTQRDACAWRVGEDHVVDWAKVYAADDSHEFRAALATADGLIAVAGRTDAGPANVEVNPLFAKLDPATGDLVWSLTVPVSRGGAINALAEAPDGTLFGVGAATRDIRKTGAALAARVAGDGDPGSVLLALFLQDENLELVLDDFGAWEDTAGGDTGYDELFDIAPLGDGFVVVGRTGLGTDAAAWTAKMNGALGLEWFTTADGDSADALDGVAVSPEAIFASGFSSSLPSPGSSDNDSQLWLSKLPRTGRGRFAPEVNVTTRYLAPGIRDGSGVTPMTPITAGTPGPAGFATSDAIVESAGVPADLIGDPLSLCVNQLGDSGRVSLRDACLANDRDEDGTLDRDDVCPDWPDDQTDSDGNGIGDACECGDQNGDGTVNLNDLFAIEAALVDPSLATPLCDVNGDDACNLLDLFGVNDKILGHPAYCAAYPAP